MDGIIMQDTASMARAFLEQTAATDQAVTANSETVLMFNAGQFLQYQSGRKYGFFPGAFGEQHADGNNRLPTAQRENRTDEDQTIQRRLLNNKKKGDQNNGNEVKI